MGCDIGPLYDEGQEQEIGELEKVIKLTCNSTFTPHKYAKTLYNAGYRKESETVKKIFNKLIKITEDEFKGSLPLGMLKAWALMIQHGDIK